MGIDAPAPALLPVDPTQPEGKAARGGVHGGILLGPVQREGRYPAHHLIKLPKCSNISMLSYFDMSSLIKK